MTAPRQILPGSSYLVTRRCSERRFLLRPSSATNAIVRFCLAVASWKYGIQLHAWCFLSNHFHLVLTDPQARLPDFLRYLNSLLARALNASLGRSESFWDPRSYSAVRLETAESVIEKCAYVLANPVAAGLVRRGHEWPGLWSDPGLVSDAPIFVDRPREFFLEDGPLPAGAALQLHRPPGFETDEAFVEAVREELLELEERAAVVLSQVGRGFLGVARILSQQPRAHPNTREPWMELNPNIACRDKSIRIEALLRLASFRSAYREALASWKDGVRDVLFPEGTWLMRVQHAASCAPAG